MQERVARFYLDSKELLYAHKRITVLNARGEVGGHVDFEPIPDDPNHVGLGGRHEFDLDADALDTLVIDALTPDEDKAKAGDKK